MMETNKDTPQNNQSSLTIATGQLNRYFHGLNHFWRWFFPAPLANALLNNDTSENIQRISKSSTWFYHNWLFKGLNVFTTFSDSLNSSLINTANHLKMADDDKAIQPQKTVETRIKHLSPLPPILECDEIKSLCASPISPQSYKNAFSNRASGNIMITCEIAQCVKNALEKDKSPTNHSFAPIDKLISAISQLIKAHLIKTSEIAHLSIKKSQKQEPDELDITFVNTEYNSEPQIRWTESLDKAVVNDSYFSLQQPASNVFFTPSAPQKSISETLIGKLTLHTKPDELAQLFLGMHKRGTLTLESIETITKITDDFPISLKEFKAVLNNLFNDCLRSTSEQATADFNKLCQCQSLEELHSFIDDLNELTKEKKEALTNLISAPSVNPTHVFGRSG